MISQPYSLLFVCLGNICRSPAAHGAFRQLVADARTGDQFFLDSAGTANYHQGNIPDNRMQQAAKRRGISLDDLCARQVTQEDFHNF